MLQQQSLGNHIKCSTLLAISTVMQSRLVCAAHKVQVTNFLQNQSECIVAAAADVQLCKFDQKRLSKLDRCATLASL